MNLIDYLVHHTVAGPTHAERLWQLQRAAIVRTDADGNAERYHPRRDETIEGSDGVIVDGARVEEVGTGRPLTEDEARSTMSTLSQGFKTGAGVYVFEPWIVEKLNLGRYGRAPNFVAIDDITLTEPWRRIASEEGEREQAMIETNGMARFYTISQSGPIYLANTRPVDGGIWAVRRHNLFGLTGDLEAYLNEHIARN